MVILNCSCARPESAQIRAQSRGCPKNQNSNLMPHGFFTVEQWTAPQDGARSQWIPILHLDSYQSLTKAMVTLEKRGEPGLYRIVQMQRCIWAEMEGGKLRLHGSHSSS